MFYFVNSHFALDALRVPSRSTTPTSKTNHSLGPVNDIWGVRGHRFSRIWEASGVQLLPQASYAFVGARASVDFPRRGDLEPELSCREQGVLGAGCPQLGRVTLVLHTSGPGHTGTYSGNLSTPRPSPPSWGRCTPPLPDPPLYSGGPLNALEASRFEDGKIEDPDETSV